MASATTFNQVVTEAPYPITLESREFGIYLVLGAEITELTDAVEGFTVECSSRDYRYKNFYKFNRIAPNFPTQARVIFSYDHGDGIEYGDQIYILRDGAGRVIWKTTSL